MPKFFCNLQDPDYPYPYCIKFPAAVVFSVVFGLTTLIHFGQAIHYHKKFCWVIIMAGLWETASYVLRTMSAYDISPEGFGIPSQLLVQLAPIWINAYVYMIFGRVVFYFVQDQRVGHLRARVLSVIFVLLDVICFIVQATGAIIAQSGKEALKLVPIGFNVYRGGIGAQQLFIVIFIGLAIRAQVKLAVNDGPFRYRETSWRKVLFPIYVALGLITVRIIYRLVEFSGSFDSGIANQEAPFYLLEAVPMSLCMYLFNVYHPGAVLVGEESEFPKKKKEKKSKKAKATDTREPSNEIALNAFQPPAEAQDVWDSNRFTVPRHENVPNHS